MSIPTGRSNTFVVQDVLIFDGKHFTENDYVVVTMGRSKSWARERRSYQQTLTHIANPAALLYLDSSMRMFMPSEAMSTQSSSPSDSESLRFSICIMRPRITFACKRFGLDKRLLVLVILEFYADLFMTPSLARG